MDDLGFEQAVDRLCQRVVVAVTDTANRGFDARVRQPFGVFDGQVLGSAVRMMDRAMVTPRVRVTMARPYAFDRAAFMDGLFEGIKDEPSMRGGADAPADDASGIGVDNKCDIDRAMVTPLVRVTMARPFPGGDVGEIARHCS